TLSGNEGTLTIKGRGQVYPIGKWELRIGVDIGDPHSAPLEGVRKGKGSFDNVDIAPGMEGTIALVVGEKVYAADVLITSFNEFQVSGKLEEVAN
ncbi:MAG: hypothetical protein OEY50_08045, partial [Nitrospinota bacterium]|nr:hypothetical protein [Nitrospinota bacterium]